MPAHHNQTILPNFLTGFSSKHTSRINNWNILLKARSINIIILLIPFNKLLQPILNRSAWLKIKVAIQVVNISVSLVYIPSLQRLFCCEWLGRLAIFNCLVALHAATLEGIPSLLQFPVHLPKQ